MPRQSLKAALVVGALAALLLILSIELQTGGQHRREGQSLTHDPERRRTCVLCWHQVFHQSGPRVMSRAVGIDVCLAGHFGSSRTRDVALGLSDPSHDCSADDALCQALGLHRQQYRLYLARIDAWRSCIVLRNTVMDCIDTQG